MKSHIFKNYIRKDYVVLVYKGFAILKWKKNNRSIYIRQNFIYMY